MERPKPLKHAECECCLEDAPLLMPVGFAPGFPLIVWQRMCLACRLTATSDQYSMAASDIQHGKRPETRAAYSEWLAATV
jgi:hypothetical protein